MWLLLQSYTFRKYSHHDMLKVNDYPALTIEGQIAVNMGTY